MDWSDQGIVLSRRRHGENAAVVSLLTREHGRHSGLVRGGAGKRASALWQSGNLVAAQWRARLAEHLGTLTGELVDGFAARAMDDALHLGAIASACAVLESAVPEREPHPALFDGTVTLLQELDGGQSPELAGAAYVRWEAICLAELGFGLDLETCAVTGQRTDLAYISPRTGRAVSREAGAPFADKLFALPAFFSGAEAPDSLAVGEGLRITGHFLERHVLAPHEKPEPPARTRFVDRWRRVTTLPANR